MDFLIIYFDSSYYVLTRNSGRFAPFFLAPAEGLWPSATKWRKNKNDQIDDRKFVYYSINYLISFYY